MTSEQADKNDTLTLEARGLGCLRGGRPVFDGINFSVCRGQTLLLTGPNGAGKSSLLRQIAGLLEITAGTLVFRKNGLAMHPGAHVLYAGHAHAVKPYLSASENLDFWASACGVIRYIPADVLDTFGLAHLADLPARALSEGQKRRLALCRLALLPRPVWLLDEPAVSLDEKNKKRLRTLIEAHCAQGGMVLVATHMDSGLERVRRLALGPQDNTHNGTAV